MQSPPPRSGDGGKPWEPCGLPYTWNAVSSAIPTPVDSIEDLHVCSVSLGQDFTLLLTDEGMVYGVGHNNAGQLARESLPEGKACTAVPVQIPLDKSIKNVECGWEHCAAVTTEGELYMWGRSDAGQCGVPPDQKVVTSPRKVEFAEDVVVDSVSCGVSHTLAIDTDGGCWSWGQGFQLGHGEDRSISHVPRRVEGLRSYWVITAAAGGRHSVVLAVKRSVMPSPDAVWLASIDYQIWAWGENEFGQLGVGDHSARAVPTEVTKLQSLRCVNIAAGGEHTITRTCLGHIYTWGAVENSDGRVTRDRVTPVRLPYFDGKGVVAIAASSKASILLGASGTSDLSVVYLLGSSPATGEITSPQRERTSPNSYMSPLQPDSGPSSGRASPVNGHAAGSASSRTSESGSNKFAGVPTALSNIAHIGFVRVVVAGGDSCGLLAHDKGVSAAISMLLRELASSEITFVNSLREALRNLLLPFAKAVRVDPSQYFPVTASKDAFDSLIATHSEIWHVACTSATQFSIASVTGNYGNMFEVFQRLKPLELYRQYVDALCDAIAIGVFVDQPRLNRGTKPTHDFPDMMLEPIKRIERYATLLNRLMALLVADEENCACAKKFALEWDGLSKSAEAALATATETGSFWSQHQSLRKAFGNPTRRVVLHSKEHPLHLNKVLSGSTWYILCEDALLVPQVFSHREYPLNTLWIEDVEDTDSVQNGIRILSAHQGTGTMVESFIVYTESKEDKVKWMSEITRCTCEFVVSYNENTNVAQLASGAVARLQGQESSRKFDLTLKQLERRFICFRVSGHPDFKDAVFEGEATLGRVTGRGHFLCDDGRVYKGHFKDGLCDGFCEMTAPDGIGADRLVKGPWTKGRLHGIAFVSSYDGSTFCGSYVNGIREGHGTWVSEVDDRYVGGWKANMRHRYGVYEYGNGGSRYLGMWVANERCGRGVVVKKGLFYEGDFVANKLSGKGNLVTEDDYVYEGEFSSDCHLYGKGKLTMPNGDHVEGVFKGRWQDRSGIQVTGTYFQHSSAHAAEQTTKAHQPLTTHLREPCVPVEYKWSSTFYGCVMEFAAEQPPPLDPDLSPDDIGPHLVELFKQTGHPLNRLIISLISALKAAYGSRTVTHHRLLSDLIVELQHLSGQLDAIVRQFFPEHHSAHAALHGDSAMYEYLLQTIMLDELYPEVLSHLYQANFAGEEGAYANGVSRLNLESDVDLFNRFGAPRHLWLLSPEREEELRTATDVTAVDDRILSPIRSFDASTMEIGFQALSPTSDNRMRPSVTTVTRTPSQPKPGVVPSVLASWGGKTEPHATGLSPMSVALESRAGDLAGLRAALASAPLDRLRTETALLTPKSPPQSQVPSSPYAAAINCLKTLPSQSRPAAKLEVLATVFLRMTEAVRTHLNGAIELGGMDEVLPIFLFILVRAAVPHLRSELQYLFDFTDFDSISGEKEIMLTTLRAGFFQLLKETKK